MLNSLFRGEHSRTLSKNGRLLLPAPYRQIIERLHREDDNAPDNIDRFHMLIKPHDRIINVCRGRELMFWVEKNSLSEAFEARALPRLGKDSKIKLPEHYITHLDKSSKDNRVLLHGCGDHFKIATAEEFQREREKLEEDLIKLGYDPATAVMQILWELEHPQKAEKLRRKKHNPGRFA
jgi:DNA-binding transcriptional regulator/RsmH inhibitor MraZ